MKHEWVMLTEFKDGLLCFLAWSCERCLACRQEKDDVEDCPGERLQYQLVEDPTTEAPGILGLSCGRISYHRDDVASCYCGYCNRFHDK